MGYRRAILGRWARRDRLAVVVVAVTVAFLTGTALLLAATGAQTTAIAAEYDSRGTATFHASPAAANAAAPPDAVVLPLTTARHDGQPRVVIGVPPGENPAFDGRTIRGGSGTTLGTIARAAEHQLAGPSGAVIRSVNPREPRASVVPAGWYATDAATVRELGATGALVLAPSAEPVPKQGVLITGVLGFFLAGTRQALAALGAVALGGALLVAVTVFSVSRMTVRDRLATVRVARATGASPRQLGGLFAGRALLLTAAGVLVGSAAGVVAANGAVTLAVALGVPTALPVAVTGRVLGVVVPMALGLVVVGALAGALAVRPMLRVPPGELNALDREARRRSSGSRWGRPGDRLSLRLLDWRALVPTAATLTAFVVLVVLVVSMAGVAAPITASSGATITEPGSSHPVASQVPASYAGALRARGIDASAEILLFGVRDGRPYSARGANYSAFASVTDARLVAGRQPTGTDEAAVGADLARSLDVGVGETITLGGSTTPGVDRVRVVGRYAAPGPYDDQLLVSLPTARHLANRAPGTVQFVRAERLPDAARAGPAIAVVGLRTNGSVVAGEPFTATVHLQNTGLDRAERTVVVRYRGQTTEVTRSLAPGETRAVGVRFGAGPAGRHRLRAGNATATVAVVAPDRLSLERLPDEVPPGSAPRVRVVTAAGRPVANATVRVDDRSVRTDDAGRVRVPFEAAGRRTLTVTAGERSLTRTVTVSSEATRTLLAQIDLTPDRPSALTRPTARVTLANPWREPVEGTVRLAAPGGPYERAVRVPPGGTRTVSQRLPRRPPGDYRIAVTVDGRPVADQTYAVTGDDRLVTAAASSGRTGTTGIGRALQVAVGNLQVVLATVVGLAGAMTVGATTATFAQAVHARRRTVGITRAVGADPRAVRRAVVADAVVIGGVAALLATGLGLLVLRALARLGYLTAYGIRLSPAPSLPVVVGVVAGALLCTVVGAVVATRTLLRAEPAALLAGDHARPGGDEDG